MLEIIHKLPSQSLRSLAASLREGPLAAGITRFALQQVAGSQVAELERCLRQLSQDGFTPGNTAILIDAVAGARGANADPSSLFDLVLSGPDVPGIPTADTASVMHTLFEEAESEVLLVCYTIHNGKRLFERLAERMTTHSSLRVAFYLDIPRNYSDTSSSEEIVRRFAVEFRKKHWPWPQLPELYYDSRSLSESREQRSSLHAKCVVIDRRIAFVTSANFTDAAQHRNIEAGVIVWHKPFVERLAAYLQALQQSRIVQGCRLM